MFQVADAGRIPEETSRQPARQTENNRKWMVIRLMLLSRTHASHSPYSSLEVIGGRERINRFVGHEEEEESVVMRYLLLFCIDL